jgi:hypothetical protein
MTLYQQAENNISAEPGVPGRFQDGGRLVGIQHFARPAGLAFGGVDERGHVVHDVTVGLGVAEGPGQRVLRKGHRPTGVVLRQVQQDAAYVVCGQLP